MYPLSTKVCRTDIPQMTYVHCLLSALETCFSTNERISVVNDHFICHLKETSWLKHCLVLTPPFSCSHDRLDRVIALYMNWMICLPYLLQVNITGSKKRYFIPCGDSCPGRCESWVTGKRSLNVFCYSGNSHIFTCYPVPDIAASFCKNVCPVWCCCVCFIPQRKSCWWCVRWSDFSTKWYNSIFVYLGTNWKGK